MSLRTPPVLVTGAEPKKPVKNRVSMMVCRSLAVAVPKDMTAAMKYGARTAGLRPKTSDKGAQTSGPRPSPNSSNDVPRVDTSNETPNSSPTCFWPVEKLFNVSALCQSLVSVRSRSHIELAHVAPGSQTSLASAHIQVQD